MHLKPPLRQHLSKIVMHGWHRVPHMTTHTNADWQDKTLQVSISFFFDKYIIL